MTGVSHVVLIDESGNGRRLPDGLPDPGVRSLWVTVGVALAWERRPFMDALIQGILRHRFDNRCDELRAANLRRYLPDQYDVAEVARDVAEAVVRSEAMVWVAGARAGARMPLPALRARAEAKDVARQLLLETISGFPVSRVQAPESWLMIWDVSDAGELADFSRTIRSYRDRISGFPAPPALAPVMVGGLSHEWGGIQVADLYANFALHRLGRDLGLGDAKLDRAEAFDTVLLPTLKRGRSGDPHGLRFWQ